MIYDDDNPTPYDMLLETVKHVEQLSEAMVVLSNKYNQSVGEIAHMRADIGKLAVAHNKLNKMLQELIHVNS